MTAAARNIRLYPWYKFCQNLLFWQAVWFLYLQNALSAAEAIALYAMLELSTTLIEVPSGYVSDRIGRRRTLIVAAVCGALGATFLFVGAGFWMFACGMALLGASGAFASGTDTSLLYESLTACGREQEVEAEELRAWRFSFAGLALSAVVGGGVAGASLALPFLMSAAAFVAQLILVLRFEDGARTGKGTSERQRLIALQSAFRNPVLLWLMVLTLAVYTLGHIPFVFGQPFIAEALGQIGMGGEAPLVSGVVTALMMLMSVAATWLAAPLRKRVGLPALFLGTYAMHILLTLVLALTSSVAAILFLLLRKVPDSLSRAFVTARIHPLLQDDMRATYLSMVSLIARLFFSATLFVASFVTDTQGTLSLATLQWVLTAYALGGAMIWVGLAATVRRVPLEADHTP